MFDYLAWPKRLVWILYYRRQPTRLPPGGRAGVQQNYDRGGAGREQRYGRRWPKAVQDYISPPVHGSKQRPVPNVRVRNFQREGDRAIVGQKEVEPTLLFHVLYRVPRLRHFLQQQLSTISAPHRPPWRALQRCVWGREKGGMAEWLNDSLCCLHVCVRLFCFTNYTLSVYTFRFCI